MGDKSESNKIITLDAEMISDLFQITYSIVKRSDKDFEVLKMIGKYDWIGECLGRFSNHADAEVYIALIRN